jgi:predicted RNA-binding protein with PIN domain
MRIVVDGYNLIRQWPELAMLDRGDLQSGREALLHLLQAYRRARGHRITVVFDGREHAALSDRAESAAGIDVRFSRRGETADSVIALLVAQGGGSMVVVSSDREVAATARKHGAATLPSTEFIARVEASRIAAVKGGEEEERQAKSGKGTARRLPKAERRRQQRIKAL